MLTGCIVTRQGGNTSYDLNSCIVTENTFLLRSRIYSVRTLCFMSRSCAVVLMLCRGGWPLLFRRSFVSSRRCWASCSRCTSSARFEPRSGSTEKPGTVSGTRSDIDIHCLMLGSLGPKPTELPTGQRKSSNTRQPENRINLSTNRSMAVTKCIFI